jgi:hypothetical protein
MSIQNDLTWRGAYKILWRNKGDSRIYCVLWEIWKRWPSLRFPPRPATRPQGRLQAQPFGSLL